MDRIYEVTSLFALCLAFSWASTGQAERAEQIFFELSTTPETGQKYTLLEEDLNAYITRELTDRPLRGIDTLTVKLNEGTFTTSVRVDLSEVELTGYLQYIGSLVEGPQRLTVEGILEVSEGSGIYRTEHAWLNDVPLPASLVDTLLSSLGRQQEPPFDPTEPFKAPYGISHLTIEPGKAILSK